MAAIDELLGALAGFDEFVAIAELLREPDPDLRMLALEDARGLVRTYSDPEDLDALVRIVHVAMLDPIADVRVAALDLVETITIAELGREPGPDGLAPLTTWPGALRDQLGDLLRTGFADREPDVRAWTSGVAAWLDAAAPEASPLRDLVPAAVANAALTSYYEVDKYRLADDDASALAQLLVLRRLPSSDAGTAVDAALWRRFPHAVWMLLRGVVDGGLLVAVGASAEPLPASIERRVVRAFAAGDRDALRAAARVVGARARAGSLSAELVASLRRAAETRPIDLAIEVLGTWHLVGGSEEAGPAMLRCMDAEHDYQRARVVLASGDAPARAIAWRRELLTRASYDPARQVRDTAGIVLRWLIGAGQGEPWIASAIAAAKQST